MSERVDPLTVTREELYELVWSKPLIELAEDFGLSDVALAKRCRKLRVPVPGRGYWARIAAGQAPRQPLLPKREEQTMDYAALTFVAPSEPTPAENLPPGTAEQTALREKIVALHLAVTEDLLHASAPVKRTAVNLKRPWRKEISWLRGEKRAPLIHVSVSALVEDRALRICERLVSSANMVGWQFKNPPEPKEGDQGYRRAVYVPPSEAPKFGCFNVEGEVLSFEIDERHRQIDHVLTEEEKERKRRDQWIRPPRWDLIPTGELRLHLLRGTERDKIQTWKDRARAPLEEQVNKILLGFLDEALRIKSRREGRRLAEIEERRKEEQRWRQSQRRADNANLIHELEAQAGSWLRARMFRAYLRAFRRAAGDRKVEAVLDRSPINFFAWADHYVDQLDPLSDVPHDLDLMDESLTSYGRREEGIRDTLSRLLGRHWQESWKINEPPQGAPEHTESD